MPHFSPHRSTGHEHETGGSVWARPFDEMPDEDLGPNEDKFDLTNRQQASEVGLLVPAVQQVTNQGRRVDTVEPGFEDTFWFDGLTPGFDVESGDPFPADAARNPGLEAGIETVDWKPVESFLFPSSGETAADADHQEWLDVGLVSQAVNRTGAHDDVEDGSVTAPVYSGDIAIVGDEDAESFSISAIGDFLF